MVRFLRLLRLVTRLGCLAVLCITAIAAWQNDPSNWQVSEDLDTMAPPRQSSEGFSSKFTEHVSGGPVSISIFGLTITDPFLGLISAISAPKIFVPVLLACLVPILLTLCFGRVFCGYVCPVGWLAVGQFRLKRRLKRLKQFVPSLKPKPSNIVGIAFLAIIILIAMAGLSSTAALVLVHLQVQNSVANLGDPDVLWTAIGVISAFFIVNLVVAPGLWCKHFCPSGTLYRLVGSHPLFRIAKKTSKKCPAKCTSCNDSCWLFLDPKGGNPGPACDMCLTCAKMCPQKKLGPTLPSKSKGSSSKRALFVLIPLFFLMAQTSHANPTTPKLDGNPPWSTKINNLDWEGWSKRDGKITGLSISFVEQTQDGLLYMFSASSSLKYEDGEEHGPVEFILTSDGRTESLVLKEPNSPRSTVNRELYSGRSLVDEKACNTLEATFTNSGHSIAAVFPKRCRSKSLSSFVLSFFGWTALVTVLAVLGFLISRRENRKEN